MADRKKELTPSRGIAVKVKTPAEISLFSRGFYQVEEDCLYVPVYPAGTFYSYVDAKRVDKSTGDDSGDMSRVHFSFDIDREGRLLFIKVSTPRRFWKIKDKMDLPAPLESADLRFLTFRASVGGAGIFYSPAQSTVFLRLNQDKIANTYMVTDNIIAGVSPNNFLAALWVSDITEDRAAQNMAQWRKELRVTEDSDEPTEKFTRIEIE